MQILGNVSAGFLWPFYFAGGYRNMEARAQGKHLRIILPLPLQAQPFVGQLFGLLLGFSIVGLLSYSTGIFAFWFGVGAYVLQIVITFVGTLIQDAQEDIIAGGGHEPGKLTEVVLLFTLAFTPAVSLGALVLALLIMLFG